MHRWPRRLPRSRSPRRRPSPPRSRSPSPRRRPSPRRSPRLRPSPPRDRKPPSPRTRLPRSRRPRRRKRMAEIPATLVKQLRDETGAGMMDAKRALQETEADLDAARKLLRERGMAEAGKRAGKETTEGVVLARVSGEAGTLVAVGCEPEPVSKNDEFRAFAEKVLDTVDEQGPEAVAELEQERQELVGKLGENIQIRGATRFHKQGDDEVLSAYVHPPANKIGVLVRARGPEDVARLLAMHISFAAPLYCPRDEIPGGDL